ncbi:hypothetical protein WICMUC_004197 [Wickerhamomyces mucosus]|uniref:Uncharacterized protein n=1 Tax=Wickerhamomyces mucosus TaxID=1378264 RepID=A0A9P8TBI2_9ASCO|nr:hypothetical protein WICMUC_004197 [Wickerhamomyces mucosus]
MNRTTRNNSNNIFETSRLNSFRFNNSSGTSPNESVGLRIDTNASDDSFPPESYCSSPNNDDLDFDQQSEASLIFERNVEDPNLPTKCPRCSQSNNNSHSNNNAYTTNNNTNTTLNDNDNTNDNNNNNNNNNNNSTRCRHHSINNLPSHFSMENYVSPCLDATAEILTNENTDLDNVEMVYSRRPSTILLSQLNRSKSIIDSPFQRPPTSRSQSFANIKEPNSPIMGERPQMLSFYSYADVINNEGTPRSPSISHSLNSSFIRSNSINSPSQQQQRIPLFQQPQPQYQSQRTPIVKKGFQLESTSPNSSDSEYDYSPSQYRPSPSSRKNSLQSRSSINRLNSRNSFREGEEGEFVISSVGDQLRRNKEGINRSRHNSIII